MAGFVYLLTHTGMPGVVKIGMTTYSPRERLSSIRSATRLSHGQKGYFELAYYSGCPGSCAAMESRLHAEFAEFRIGYPELFRVDVEVAREAMERLCRRPAFVGDPHRTGMDRWPYPRPRKARFERIPNSGCVYGWMLNNRHEMSERVVRPDFSWLAFAHEMQDMFGNSRPYYWPVPPDMLQHLWQCICGVRERHGEYLNRGYLGHGLAQMAHPDAI